MTRNERFDEAARDFCRALAGLEATRPARCTDTEAAEPEVGYPGVGPCFLDVISGEDREPCEACAARMKAHSERESLKRQARLAKARMLRAFRKLPTGGPHA